MPVEHQRVHLHPSLNTLTAPDGDRQAARRYLNRLAERARAAETEQDFAAVLAEIAAPEAGLLPQLVQSLISTWATWGERRREAGLDEEPADQLMETTSSLSNHARRITQIRNQAARRTPPGTASPGPAAAPPATSSAPSARRR